MPAEPPAPPYRVAAERASAELREKGSRFLALLIPVAHREEALRELAAVRAHFPDATHHCWAWRLGQVGAPASLDERSNDDGEPAGTAGAPMLRVLRGAEVSDVLGVVVRWFGGTKLGKGGLARAYAGALREALAMLPTSERHPLDHLRLAVPYERVGAVKRLVHPPEVELLGERYGEAVTFELAVRQSHRAGLDAALADLGIVAEAFGPT